MGDNIWDQILKETRQYNRQYAKYCDNKLLLVTGCPGSGKTRLLNTMAPMKSISKGGPCFDYGYIEVSGLNGCNNLDGIEKPTLSVWTINEEDDLPDTNWPIQYALTRDSFPHAAVLLVASMEQPGNMLQSLEKQAAVLESCVNSLRLDENYFKSISEHFHSYTDPTVSWLGQAPQRYEDNEELGTNLGLPIIVVITKMDLASRVRVEMNLTGQHFEYLQLKLRKFCLRYGASLVYTSAKNQDNTYNLLMYILHRLFQQKFILPADATSFENIFIPCGYDRMKKIDELFKRKGMAEFEEEMRRVVKNTKPVVTWQVELVEAEDETSFRTRLQNIMREPLVKEDRVREFKDYYIEPEEFYSPNVKNRNSFNLPLGHTPKKLHPVSSPGEQVLSNFFTQLLKSSSKSGSTSKVNGSGTTYGSVTSTTNSNENPTKTPVNRRI